MDPMTLPRHPRSGMAAVGWRKPRTGESPDQLYPIWPVLGAAPDEEDEDQGDEEEDDGQEEGKGDQDEGDGQGDEDDEADPEGADALGDRGKRALASMKGKWRSEREKRRTLEQQLAESGTPQGDGGGDADRVRREAEQAATAKANKRIVRSEIRAAAAGKLADPKDALTFLDLEQFEVDEDGEIDSEEIADAIAELVNNKPYLAAAKAPKFQGTGDGGAARKAGKPKQLTRDDVKRMSPGQIVKAKDEGRLNDVLGINR